MQHDFSGGQDRQHDYMSDDLLNDLQDVRPGLLNREDKRRAKVGEHSLDILPKSRKVKIIEEEAREKGLAAPISSENKGYAILQKMGYKEGTCLGRSGVNQRYTSSDCHAIVLLLFPRRQGNSTYSYRHERWFGKKYLYTCNYLLHGYALIM